jgi:hypothetical protein
MPALFITPTLNISVIENPAAECAIADIVNAKLKRQSRQDEDSLHDFITRMIKAAQTTVENTQTHTVMVIYTPPKKMGFINKRICEALYP